MNVKVVSDLHGRLIDIKDKFDLLLICGDTCPTLIGWFYDNSVAERQAEWFRNEFMKWVDALPFKNEESKVVMIAGNHDFVFEKKICLDDIKNHDRIVYLENEEYTFICHEEGNEKSVSIYGTPYCKPYGGWAFMTNKLSEAYEGIPYNLDILISHDAADIDGLGVISEGRQKGTNAGNTVLAEAIKEKKPKYYFCGHIHTGKHGLREIDMTNIANVSVLNEKYELVNNGLNLNL